jgi:hemoglobin
MAEPTLYDRLGGVFAIAAVVDHFSDAVVRNPIVGRQSENPQLREWHTNNLGRLPGLKFMRSLWVCEVAGGPQQYSATKPGGTSLGLEEAHRELKISPAEFDEVAAELAGTLNFFKVPEREKGEVLAAFVAHSRTTTSSSASSPACARHLAKLRLRDRRGRDRRMRQETTASLAVRASWKFS